MGIRVEEEEEEDEVSVDEAEVEDTFEGVGPTTTTLEKTEVRTAFG